MSTGADARTRSAPGSASARSRVAELPTLRDVDLAEDAAAVAREVPGSRFAAAVEESAIGRRRALGVSV